MARMDTVRVGGWGAPSKAPSKAPSSRSEGSEEAHRRGGSGFGGRIQHEQGRPVSGYDTAFLLELAC